MKKYLLSLVSFMLVCFAASAETYYRIDASKVISADATALDGITAVVTDVAGEKTWVSFSGGDGQDINANCTTVHDWSSNSEYSSIKFFAVEGQADDVYYIKFVNAEGAFYVPKGGWHDQSGCMNVTGNGGGLFVGGLNGQNGQDAANGALWKVTKTAEGYTLYNIGKERYAVPGIGVTATETSVVLYSEFESVTYDPEAEGDYTGRIVNNKVNGADGWTCERPVGGNGPLLGGTAFEYWAGSATSRTDASFNYYQTITGLPAGKYVLGAEMYNSSNGEGEDHEPNGNAGLYIANGESESFVGVTEDGTALKPYTTQEIEVNEGDEITVGVKSIGYMSARWFVADNFTLHRTGDLPKRKLDNADFAEGVIGDVNIATYAKDGEVNQMQPVPGWEFGVENGDARAAGVVAYGSATTLGGADYKVPTAGPEGTNGNALAVVGVWTGTVKYVQDVTLPAGKYTMTVPVYNTAGTQAFVTNYIGVKYGETEVLASAKSYAVGKWTDETVVFELAEETNVTVSLGYEGANAGSGASQHLFYDCVKIEPYDEVAVAKAAALAALPVGDESIFTPNAEDVEAVKAAIEAATTVEEVETAAATEFEIPALSGEWTIKNATAQMYINGAVISETPAIITFEKAEGGFYMKSDDTYVNMKGGNTWSMSADAEAKTAWTYTLADGVYTIKGPNGNIGVDYGIKAPDNTDDNLYGNKSGNGTTWVIEAYVAPDPYATTLAVAAGEGSSYLTDVIKINEQEYNAYKIGTAKATGSINVTVPAGSYGVSFYALSWSTATTDVTATAGEKTQTYTATGAGISGNSPYTYDAEKGGEPETHLYKFGYSEPLAEDVVVNLTAPARIVFFGINALTEPVQEEAAGWDGTVTSSLDDVTMTSVAQFEGITLKFNGAKSIVVNSIEEDGETLYGSFEAWNPDFSEYYMWNPYYGSTYEVNGDEITLTGWIDVNAMMGDTELQTKIAKKLARRVAEGDTDYQFEMMDYGETFIIDGEVYEEQIDLFFNAKEASAVEPFAFTVINNNVEAESAETKEATEVSVMFQISSDYDVEKGEGVPTLSANGEDQGAATVIIVDGVGVIKFEAAPAATDGVFTAAGTYTLTIPEGTFVDVNGAPNALFGASWVIIEKEEPVLADGDYLIKNAEFGKYLNGSNDWGTKASITEHGQFMTIALNDGKYSIKSHYSNGGGKDYLAAGDNTYLDAAVVYHEIEEVEGGYTIKDQNGKYLVSDGNVANFNGDEPQVWQFLSKEDVIASLADATAEAPVDATALVPDADFSRNNTDFNKWEGESKMGKGGPNNAKDATARGMNAERWGGNSTSIDFHTTLTDLPNGKYTVKFQGLYRYNNTTDNTNDVAAAAHADGSEYIAANFYANEIAAPFTSVADEASVELYGKMPFSQAEASEAFTKGCYQNELTVVVTDGTLTLKVVKLEADHEGCDWTVLDNIELYYLGDNSGEPENIVIETAEVGTTVVPFEEINNTYYTATVKFQKPVGAKYAYSEGLMLEGSNVPFALGAYGFVSLEEGNEVTLVYKDALKAKTDDPTFDGDLRQPGTYAATTEIYFMDEDQLELPVIATFTGSIVLPDLNETGINEVKFHINSVVYTINGVRVQKPVKGINIINGKKVVIK